jgi:CheY-like chemotaxis protein
VDVDPSILGLATVIIEREGYSVLAATDGKMAFKLLRSGEPIAAVVMDIFMPYINGTDIMSFMKSDPVLKNVPVIIMTGEQDPQLMHKSLSAGAIAFLPKPFTPAQLTNMLRTFAGGRLEVSKI